MNITICGRRFDTDDIININIKTDPQKIFIDTKEDFYNLTYRSEEDIYEARQWLKLQTLTLQELNEAISVIVHTCNYFINTSNQCAFCPIKRSKGCFFQTIPINWR